MIPFCDVGWQYTELSYRLAALLGNVLTSGRYILGDDVKLFENEAAEYTGAPHALAVASGTDALVIALKAAGVAANDEVICPSLTFVATAHAIRRVGAKPVFVDVERDTLLIDPDCVEEAVSPQTTAVLPVHLYGAVCDMEAIGALAERHGLVVIEDAAQAFGAKDESGRYAGAAGDVGCYSFFPTKPLGAAGDGGMLVTSSTRVYERAESLRRQGFQEKNHAAQLGLNSRLDTLQAVILREKLTELPAWQKMRNEAAGRYAAAFVDIQTHDVLLPPLARGTHAWHLYVVQVEDRPRFRQHLRERGVPTLVHYDPPVHQQPYYGPPRHARRLDLTNTETIAPRLCSLPLWAGMPDEDIDTVIDAVRSYYAEL